MKLFKKAILGLSLTLFAIQPARAEIFSRVANFAKKHDKITSGLASIAAVTLSYNLFPQSYMQGKILDKYIVSLEINIDPIIYETCLERGISPFVLGEFSEFIYSDKGKKLIYILKGLRFVSSLAVGYMAYKKTNEYLNKDKKQN